MVAGFVEYGPYFDILFKDLISLMIAMINCTFHRFLQLKWLKKFVLM
jgi:hypothetical protein